MNYLRILLINCFLLAGFSVQGASYKGRPFVLIDVNNNQTPEGGRVQGFSSSQLIGDEVVYTVQNSDFKIFGLLSGRGMSTSALQAQTLIAGQKTSLPGWNGSVDEFGFNFRRAADSESDNGFAFTALGTDGAMGLFQYKDGVINELQSSGDTLPESGGLNWTRIGEPNYVNGRVAWLGFHRFEDNSDFRGVYIYDNGIVERIADSNTELPGGVGTFEGSSSQVGFDGQTVVFWGGPLENNQGMFAAEDAGSLRALAVKGDTIPGTGLVIESFMSPPVVDDGVVYFVAFSEGFTSHLLKSENGTLSTVVANGAPTPDGLVFDQIGSAGMIATEGKLYFTATGSPTHAGVYVLEDGEISTVINNETPLYFQATPISLILRDAVGDKLLIQNVSSGGRTVTLHATLDMPAVPVIVEQPQSVIAELGEDVTFSIRLIGPDTVTYQWTKNGRDIEGATGPDLTLSSVQIEDASAYRVKLEVDGQRMFSDIGNLELNIAPAFTSELEDRSMESGDALNIRVNAVGLAPLSYEWTKNGEVLPQFTGPSVFISPAFEPDSGVYQVTVKNSLGESVSRAAEINVLPPPPNPAYQGKRFLRAAGGDSPIEGAEGPFRASTYSDGRVVGDSLVFRYFDTVGFPQGYASLKPDGTVSVVVSVNEMNQLFNENYSSIGNAAGDSENDKFVFEAYSSNTRGASLFLWNNGELTKLFDHTEQVPGEEGVQIGGLTNVLYKDGRVVFLSIENQNFRIMEYADGVLRTLVSPSDTLPESVAPFQGNILEYDGNRMLFRTLQGLYQMDQDRNVTLIAKAGDTLGDSTMSFFGPAAYTPFGIALLVQDAANKFRFALQSETGWDVFLSPGDTVGENLPVTFLSGGSLAMSGDKILIEAGIGGTRGLVSYSVEKGIEPVLAAAKMDAERHNNLRLLGANGQSVFVTTEYSNGNSYFYANIGESVETGGNPTTEQPTLDYSLSVEGKFQFIVPDGFQLQRTPTLFDINWDPIQGQGTVEVETSGASGFFRLSKP